MSLKGVKKFWNDCRGYVIALTLVAMPMLLGFSLLVIDVGRGNNLHTDLQDAVDAMALTGARELDGRDDAIPRAQTAISRLINKANFGGGGAGMSLGTRVNVVYDPANLPGSSVVVKFLTTIPASDHTAIDAAFLATYETADSNLAAYAYVKSTPHAMQTVFPIPVGLNRDTVNIAAEAVAVYRASACDVTPVYICNPFENLTGADPAGSSAKFHEAFSKGELYGIPIELHNTGASKVGPGNFGFLRTTGNGANVLSNALATGSPGLCYKQDSLETEPGAIAGPVEQGLNTRFGLYGASFKQVDNNWRYRPSANVRKAQKQTLNANKICTDYQAADEAYDAVPLGYNATMTDIPGGGGKIATGNNWDINMYWDITHSGKKPSPLKADPAYVPPVLDTTAIKAYSSSYPGGVTPVGVNPSSYDVYKYELGTGNINADTSPSGEKGIPQCHKSYNVSDYPASTYGDRREIFAAIVNCIDQDPKGQTNVEAVAFARMFLVKPAVSSGSDRYMTMETIDITGSGGRGTLNEFLREEAELVR